MEIDDVDDDTGTCGKCGAGTSISTSPEEAADAIRASTLGPGKHVWVDIKGRREFLPEREKECRYEPCGRLFMTADPRRKNWFCKAACRDKHKKRKYEDCCAFCGGPMPDGSWKNRRFCNKGCRNKARRSRR